MLPLSTNVDGVEPQGAARKVSAHNVPTTYAATSQSAVPNAAGDVVPKQSKIKRAPKEELEMKHDKQISILFIFDACAYLVMGVS